MEKAVSPGNGKMTSATQGHWVALRDVEQELRNAWMIADEEVRQAKGEGMLRLREVNLVIHAGEEAAGGRARASAARVMREHPGRVILLTPGNDPVLLSEPTEDCHMHGGDPAAFISTACFRDEESGRQVCSEEVVIQGPGEKWALPAAVLHLLVPDLPVVTWWLGDLEPSSPHFRWLTGVSDQLIMDSASLDSPARELRDLVGTTPGDGEPHHAAIRDLSWLRAAAWRKLVAELFQGPERRLLLTDIDRLVVEHDSAFLQALLFASWFGSRLGFVTAGDGWWWEKGGWCIRLVGSRETDRPGPRVDADRRLTVELREVAKGIEATPGLVAVSVLTNSPDPGEDIEGAQSIYLRRWPHSYSCVACVTGGPAEAMSKALELPPDEDWELVSAVLESPGRDPLFEEAAHVAADLLSSAGAPGLPKTP